MQLRVLLAALAMVVFGSGCSAINDFGRFMFDGDGDGGVDAGAVDAGPDAMVDPDGGLDAGTDAGLDAGPRPPTAIVQTAGGETVLENSSYRLRVSVGAPVPVGDVGDSSHRLRVGPQVR